MTFKQVLKAKLSAKKLTPEVTLRPIFLEGVMDTVSVHGFFAYPDMLWFSVVTVHK